MPAFKKAAVGGGERDTQCTSKLKVVESPCTDADGVFLLYIVKNHM
jgi:hypothetical protein